MALCKNCGCPHPVGNTCTKPLIDCEEVKRCETVTSLSAFTITGTKACTTFIDERGIEIERCFDVSVLLNKVLENVDPKCVATEQEWDNFDFAGKIQAIVNKACTPIIVTPPPDEEEPPVDPPPVVVTCPAITSLDVTRSGNVVTYNSVTYGVPVTQSRIVSIRYKVTGTTDSPVIVTDALVAANGMFLPAIPINTLAQGTSYDFQVVDSCNNVTTTTVFIPSPPAIVNYYLDEQADPYIDGNIQIKNNGDIVAEAFIDGEGQFTVPGDGDITFICFGPEVSNDNPIQPKATFTVFRNGTQVFGTTVIATTSLNEVYSEQVVSGATYDVYVATFS